jgi:hypothetical protein
MSAWREKPTKTSKESITFQRTECLFKITDEVTDEAYMPQMTGTSGMM